MRKEGESEIEKKKGVTVKRISNFSRLGRERRPREFRAACRIFNRWSTI